MRHADLELRLDVKIKIIDNPSIEMVDHYDNLANTDLFDLSLKPTILITKVVTEMLSFVMNYLQSNSNHKIFRGGNRT